MFQVLEEKVQLDLQLDLSPSTLLSDFELAITQAVSVALSATLCCYFHFCQTLLLKIQQLGLQTEYQENSELRIFVRKLSATGEEQKNRRQWNQDINGLSGQAATSCVMGTSILSLSSFVDRFPDVL